MENNKNEKKSFFFQPTVDRKWYELEKADRRECSYNATAGLLGGFVFSLSGSSLFVEIIGGALSFFGLIYGMMWVVLTIKERKAKK